MKKLLFICILLIIWQSFFWIAGESQHVFPSLVDVVKSGIHEFSKQDMYVHVWQSVQRVLVGFILAAVVGTGLALLFGYFKKVGEFFLPIVEMLRPIPPIAWIPIAILLFGLGNVSAYFIVFLGAFFPIFTNTFFGATTIPQVLKNVSSSFEIKRETYVFRILFFYSLPNLFTGLKIGMGMAWMSVIASELIGAQNGLGYYIQLNRLLLRTDNIVFGMILIGLIGYALMKILNILEKKIMPWRKLI